jgi:hypothetical protein
VADKRITELNPILAADTEADVDVLALADVSAAETKKITIVDAVTSAAGTLPPGTIDGDTIIDGSLSGSKLEENSVTSRELAPNSVDTIHVIDGAITNDKLAGDISGDKLLDGSVGSDQLAANSVDGALHIKDRSIPAVKLVQNTLTADEIAPNAIGSSELANGAVDTDAIQDDAISTPKYQNASVTNEKLADGIDGNKLLDGSVDGSKLIDGSIDGGKLDEVPLDKLPDAPQNTVLAGSNGGGTGPASFRPLVGDDLPAATDVEKGGVSVPGAGGLAVDGQGAIAINNTVSPGTNPVVTYNSHGLITSSRALQADDLPSGNGSEVGGVKPGNGLSVRSDGTLDVIPATQTSIGGVIEGNGITIAADGRISQSLTGVAPGTYGKVTVDNMGNVTAGADLELDDLPDLDGDLIVIDNLDGGSINDKSILRRKLADYAITFIQEAEPVVDVDIVHIGCLWFQESTATLNMWNGNSFMSVGIGRLSAENLRYCGLIDASTSTITAVTQFGTGEGFEVGDPIPEPTDELTGVYFVVEIGGNGINKTAVSGKTFDEGDWLICNGAASGWARIDTTAGGGGGGSSRLEDLLDVDVSTKQPGALLQYQADGRWKDIYALDAGTY